MNPARNNSISMPFRYGRAATIGLLLAFLGPLLLGSQARASGVICEALFAGFGGNGLDTLSQLVKRDVVTDSVAKQIIYDSESASISWRLFQTKRISEAEYHNLYFTFSRIEPTAPLGQPEKIKTAGVNGSRAEVFVQRGRTDVGRERLDLYDIKTRELLGALDYTIAGSYLSVDLIRVLYRERQLGYSEILIREALKPYSDVDHLQGQLEGTNLRILKEGLSKGQSLEEAARAVPLYRTFKKLGFEPRVSFTKYNGLYWIDAPRAVQEDNLDQIVNDPISDPYEVPTLALEGRKAIRPTVLVQEFMPHLYDESLGLLDSKTKHVLAVLNFNLRGARESLLSIEEVIVAESARNQKYSQLLLELALERHRNVDTIQAELAETNEKVLRDGITSGLSPQQAIQKTPLYRMLLSVGFKNITYRHDRGVDSYTMTARRK